MKAFLLAAALLCAAALPARAAGLPVALDVGLLVAAEVLVAADTVQTVDMTRHPERGLRENNPLLGGHPGPSRIIAMGALGGMALGAAWALMPREVRWLVPAGSIAFEAPCVWGNARLGLSIRF